MDSEKPARYVDEVIPQLCKIIPKTETDLIERLVAYNDSLWNVAPELRNSGHYWRPLEKILNSHITDIDTEWKQELVRVFNNT
jgi:hypothetical protein